ncbi:hypothetical protein AMS68_002246 [Peltaster fructicola]|uniref:Ribonuclease T2-like n=1 Tax=Peltaster fructicola TaxID=286661 RepID=A0A6H0XQ30_9PEZI|nr:hypothetical protein AMS68_002246 [Peltaster fructicola]
MKYILSLSLAAQALAGRSLLTRQNQQGNSATCDANGPLSCQDSGSGVDTCCFNTPGGALLQTQFWDTNPSSGPSNSWTIHGLWPDNCDGTYEANCDSTRAYTNITDILNSFGQQDLLNYMNTYWTSNTGSAETFWEHEWGKHGTCISTLQPSCYTNYQPTEEVPDFFNKVVGLFKTLPTYQWLSDAGITPSSSQTYTLSQITNALTKNRDGHSVYLGCNNGALDEVWYFFNVRGSVQTGTFVATDSLSTGNCPSTGIKYLPKSGSSSSGGTTTTTTTTASGSQSTPVSGSGNDGSISGSGYLNVVSGGSQNGCLISAGAWYTSGTCATYTASASGSGFTLKSSKGLCAVSSGALTCSSSVSSGTVFTASSGTLQYSGSSAFSSDSTPSGSTQAKVYSGSNHSVGLTIQWQSK